MDIRWDAGTVPEELGHWQQPCRRLTPMSVISGYVYTFFPFAFPPFGPVPKRNVGRWHKLQFPSSKKSTEVSLGNSSAKL